MRATAFLSTLAAVVLLAASAEAVDLTKIERSIRKEPAYQTKNPQYCLLVLGPEAKVRVWLVVDGDVLYVDRNGNGDLTEPGERISPHHALHNSPKRPDMKLMCDFFVRPAAKDGRSDGKSILMCAPDVTFLLVEHFIPADDRDDAVAAMFRKHPFRVDVGTARTDQDSSLAFASRPGDAPILHVDGPRQLALHPYSDSLRRGETRSLAVQMLTPGLGASMRMESAEGMENIHPVADIECPPRWPGAEPIRFRIELPGRG
jgi:hypothetical protein